MENKLKDFLNSLTLDEIQFFYRFMRTKKWTKCIETRMGGQKII